MLNQTAEYGMRAAVHLAGLEPGNRMRAAEIAEAIGVPANYLSKILHQLAAAGILESRRGRAGGFRLAVPADRLSLAKVVSPLDALERYRVCVLGSLVCSDRTACAAHDRWKPLASSLMEFLKRTTVADLLPPTPRRGGSGPRR